jgi:hypothetical protein
MASDLNLFIKSLLNDEQNDKIQPENQFVASPYAQRPWDMPILPKPEPKTDQFVASPYTSRPWDVDLNAMINNLNPIPPMETPATITSESNASSKKVSMPSQKEALPPVIPTSDQPKAKDTQDLEIRQALANYQGNLADIGLKRSIDKGLGSAYGALGHKVDEEGYRQQIKEAGLPVELLEKIREADKQKTFQDPTSARSQMTRNIAKTYLAQAGLNALAGKITDDMSAEQVDALTKGTFKDAVDNQMRLRGLQEQVASRKEIAEANRLAREDAMSVKKQEKVDKEKAKVDESTYRYNSLNKNLDKLDKLVEDEGTNVITGPEGEIMDKIIYEAAIDFAKLVDPESVAREGEVAAAQKYMLPIRNQMGLGMSNKTARQLIKDYKDSLNERMEARNSAKGAAQREFKPSSPQQPQGTNAPHGEYVQQGGKTFKWDGQKYVAQ